MSSYFSIKCMKHNRSSHRNVFKLLLKKFTFVRLFDRCFSECVQSDSVRLWRQLIEFQPSGFGWRMCHVVTLALKKV